MGKKSACLQTRTFLLLLYLSRLGNMRRRPCSPSFHLKLKPSLFYNYHIQSSLLIFFFFFILVCAIKCKVKLQCFPPLFFFTTKINCTLLNALSANCSTCSLNETSLSHSSYKLLSENFYAKMKLVSGNRRHSVPCIREIRRPPFLHSKFQKIS